MRSFFFTRHPCNAVNLSYSVPMRHVHEWFYVAKGTAACSTPIRWQVGCVIAIPGEQEKKLDSNKNGELGTPAQYLATSHRHIMENYYHFHFFSGVDGAVVHADDPTETSSDIFFVYCFFRHRHSLSLLAYCCCRLTADTWHFRKLIPTRYDICPLGLLPKRKKILPIIRSTATN